MNLMNFLTQATAKHSSMVENFLSRSLSFLLAYPTRNGFPSCSCINIAPTPTSDVSSQSKKRLSCSGNLSMGRPNTAVFNAKYASLALPSILVCLAILSLSSRSEELLWLHSWVNIPYRSPSVLEMRAILVRAGPLSLPNF